MKDTKLIKYIRYKGTPVFIKELDQCDIGTEFSLFFENGLQSVDSCDKI